MKFVSPQFIKRSGVPLKYAFGLMMALVASAPLHGQEESASSTDLPMANDLITSEPALSDEPLMEEVFITGSLLPKGNYESNAPITTISAEQFEVSNAINIEQLLNTLPQILTGEDRSSTFGLGWATADLMGSRDEPHFDTFGRRAIGSYVR